MKKVVILFFLLLLVSCSGREYLTFKTIKDAEKEIGQIKTPIMPEDYKITNITYENDGFTHPVTNVIYQNENHKIKFMIASSWFDDRPSKNVKNDKVSDMVWVSKDKEYVLKWRNSDKQSYKYLFTKNEEDKEWLISIAENY